MSTEDESTGAEPAVITCYDGKACTPERRVCEANEAKCCGEYSSSGGTGFQCTREKGHHGKHVARGTMRHNYTAAW